MRFDTQELLARGPGLIVVASLVVATTGFGIRQGVATFRSSSDRVVLDVVVTDSSDRPVLDLSKDDFEVREAGKPQSIEEFQLIRVPLADNHVSVAAVPVIDATPVSNDRPAKDSRVFAFVVDEGTLLAEDIAPLKVCMRQFLRRLAPDDRMSATYVGRSDLGQDFTADTERMRRAIEAFPIAIGSAASNDRDPTSPVKAGDVRAVLTVLNNVVQSLASMPEPRRVLVFVSRGTYPDRGRYNFEWREMYDRAVRTGIPIYTIDPTGIAAPELGLHLPLESQTPENRAVLDQTRLAAQNTLREMALNTGGRALVNKANVFDSVDQIVGENGAYYLLGFRPDPRSGNAQFRSVDVRVRRPGLRVRSRRGYSPAPALSNRPSGDTLVRSLENGGPGGDLVFRAAVGQVGTSPSTSTVVLTIDLPMTNDSGAGPSGDDKLRIVWLGLDEDARKLASGQRTLTIPTGGAMGSVTLSIVDRIEIPHSVKMLRVAVLSEKSSLAGRVHIPLDDESYARVSPNAGSLVVGIEGASNLRLVSLGDSDKVIPFPPTTLRQFHADQRIHIFCRVFGADPSHLSAELRLTHNEEQTADIHLDMRRSTVFPEAVDLQASIPLSRFVAGAYHADLLVANTTGFQVRRGSSFEVR
ncbi:MAG TPA: VWA domain-containing protein [Vicinamibacterales bacterium]|nr:VWA domain-containing protein [Vicinamibacterales bacterium]